MLWSKVLHQFIPSVLTRLHHIVTIGEMSYSSISIRIISFFEVVIFRKLLVMSTLIIVNTFAVRFRPANDFFLLLLLRNTRLVV